MLLQRVNSHVEFVIVSIPVLIPPNYLPHVFDRFSQKDTSLPRGPCGLGALRFANNSWNCMAV